MSIMVGTGRGATMGVLFKNAEALREVARQVPLDRMLIETDSPYMAPVPYRGKSNEPKYVGKVCELIAGLRGLAPDELADVVNAYYERIFAPVRDHGGTVSDVVGDAMLSLWAGAAPNAADRRAACAAALIASTIAVILALTPRMIPSIITIGKCRWPIGVVSQDVICFVVIAT